MGLLPLLLCFGGEIVCRQNVVLEEAAVRRARQFEPIIVDAARKHGVNPRLLWVIAYLETRFDPNQKSRAGARGLMQFMPATASRYGLDDPYNPLAAIEAAARYVRDLAIRFGNRADLALAAYNAGETTVEAYLMGRTISVEGRVINPKGIVTGGIPPYHETQKYVADGLQLLKRLREGQLRMIHPASSNGGSETDGKQPGPLGIVRKSIRASSNMDKAETKQAEIRNSVARRSIYFSRQR